MLGEQNSVQGTAGRQKQAIQMMADALYYFDFLKQSVNLKNLFMCICVSICAYTLSHLGT